MVAIHDIIMVIYVILKLILQLVFVLLIPTPITPLHINMISYYSTISRSFTNISSHLTLLKFMNAHLKPRHLCYSTHTIAVENNLLTYKHITCYST